MQFSVLKAQIHSLTVWDIQASRAVGLANIVANSVQSSIVNVYWIHVSTRRQARTITFMCSMHPDWQVRDRSYYLLICDNICDSNLIRSCTHLKKSGIDLIDCSSPGSFTSHDSGLQKQPSLILKAEQKQAFGLFQLDIDRTMVARLRLADSAFVHQL